ncbi:unnamed protein product, partial [Iphiclides podalirius]
MSLSSRMYTRSPNFCFLICHLTTPATYLAHIVVLRPNHHVVDKQTARKRQLELEAAKAKAAVDMELAEAEAEAKINAAKIKANIKSELLNKKLAAEMAELESTSHRSTCRGTICEIEGCNQPHHRLLHWSKPQNEKPEKTENEEEDEHPNPETVTHMVASHCHKVLLKAVPLTLHGPNGSLHTHAILDDGATVTLISADIADELGLQGENVIMRARSAWDSGELVCGTEQNDTPAVSKSETTLQLHVFCDASSCAYASVAYWRKQHGDKVQVSFIASKNRVAPLKPITVPKLELQGIVERVYPGSDGRVRVVDVRTRSGVIKRSAAHVALLRVIDSCRQTDTGGEDVDDGHAASPGI